MLLKQRFQVDIKADKNDCPNKSRVTCVQFYKRPTLTQAHGQFHTIQAMMPSVLNGSD